MALKAQALTIQYVAWNTSSQTGQTGDAANHLIRAVGDGTEFTPAATPVEVDATNLKGVYKIALSAAEMNYNCLTLGGRSTTANVQIIPVTITTGSSVGPGATATTINVINSLGGGPLQGAKVWVSTDLAGTNVIAGTLTTDAFGNVTFYLSSGTYYVWISDPGYTASNPTTITV